MILSNLFNQRESIAGLAVTDDFLRLALLETDSKNQPSISVKLLAEQSLANGIIINGEIKNEPALIKALHQLIQKTKLKVRYVILSLPANQIYTRTFTFPKSVQKEKLSEAMKLAISFQVPLPVERIYSDWQPTSNPNRTETLLATIPKSIVSSWINTLGQAKLNLVAIEFHPVSLARVIEVPEQQVLLVQGENKASLELFVIQNKTLKFMRVIPGERATRQLIDQELKRVANFFEAEGAPIEKTLALDQVTITAPYRSHPDIRKEPKRWAISLGAAARGLTPRSQDRLISLMPIGTEPAYQFQKAVNFTAFVANASVGLSIFFSLVFIAGWILMIFFQKNYATRTDRLVAIPASTETQALENRAKKLQSLLTQSTTALQTIPSWSGVLEELKSRFTTGIVVTKVTVHAPDKPIELAGIAETRPQLSAFKKSLEGSPMIASVELPLTNLELKSNIPFAIAIQLKNPDLLYFK